MEGSAGEKRYNGPLADQVTNSLNPLIDRRASDWSTEMVALRRHVGVCSMRCESHQISVTRRSYTT